MILWIIGCVHWRPSEPLVRDIQVSRICDGAQIIEPIEVWVTPTPLTPLPIRQGRIHLIEDVYALDKSGRVWFNDTIQSQTITHQLDCKLDISSIEIQGIGGTVSTDWMVTPDHNVLSTVDSGIGLSWSWESYSGELR